MSKFKIIHKDPETRARLGILTTPHGKIKTPSYVFVVTYGKFRHLMPRDIKKADVQLIIANTFHLWQKALAHKSSKSLITSLLETNLPTMTDSGGFQVLSLAFGDESKIGKFIKDSAKADATYNRSRIRITRKGVYFKFNDHSTSPRLRRTRKLFLGPELSMKLQAKIGADIIFAFDHITSPLDDFKYNDKAVEITNKWAGESLKFKNQNENLGAKKQMLFGIVQGGIYKSLRIKSAKAIGSMPFDGFGIGGSYTKKQISKMLDWVTPHLPEEKPRHLLGVGKVADIFEAVANGIDTFDCVIPTREARHGRLYTKTGYMDIRRGYYMNDKKVIEKSCKCSTCSAGISRSQIRELIKSNDEKLKAAGQRWCLMHNIWFFNNLLSQIRTSIRRDKFLDFKQKFLKSFE